MATRSAKIDQKADLIWAIADKLTGVYKPHEYGDVILPLTVIRRFDCILSDTKDAVLQKYDEVKNLPMKDILLRKASKKDFYNTSKYTFERLMDDPDHIEENFREYLNKFSANVRDILEKFKFDGHITTMANKGILYIVLKEYTTDRGNLHGPYIWNEEKVIYHYHIWKTKLVSDMDKMFSYYYLQALTESIKSQTHETTMGFVTMGIMNNSYIAYPRNIKEQKKISDYLDAKCSKIDEIIEKQLSIIEKLKEYKLSIITEAVTSGINPDVEMKDSGSVWFGNIPINWEMKRLKYVFHIQKDIAGEEGHTVLSITQRGIIPKDFSNNEGQFANSYANYQLVHKGDFAMNHMDLLTGWVDISKYEGVTSPDYRVFVLNDKNGMCPKYYLYMMQMCYSARIFYGLGQGVSGMGRWRLQADKFLNFYIPIPPYDEQKKIADYITDKVNHIEVEIDKRNKLIKKYQEYKKSLIYEVVTGKKEV